MELNKLKKCFKCNELKQLDCFTKCSSSKDGLYTYCKQCNQAKQKLFRNNNREHVRTLWRNYRNKNKLRLNTIGKTKRLQHKFKYLCYAANCRSKLYYAGERIKPFDLWCIAKRQKMRCAISGIKLTNNNISCDHIIAVTNGGLNTINNIQLVDKHINDMKNNHTQNEFLELIKQIYLFNFGDKTN